MHVLQHLNLLSISISLILFSKVIPAKDWLLLFRHDNIGYAAPYLNEGSENWLSWTIEISTEI